MTAIDKDQLKERLIDEGYVPEFGLDNTVENLLNLQKLDNPAAYEMLVEWMESGKLRKFEAIEGIDVKYLRETLHMKDPAIILAYGMLLYDPKPNAMFLKRQATGRNVYQPKR